MKILCVSPSYWPAFEYGGPIQSLHFLNKGLIKNGVELSVFTTNKGQSNEIITNKKCIVDEIEITYFSYCKYLEFLGTTGWHFSYPLINALRTELKQYNLVYILSVWNFTTAITAYYCKKYKIPYVLSPRGQLYDEVAGIKSWKKLPYYKLIAGRIIKNAEAVHYTSDDEYLNVHERLGLKNKAIISPNGIDLNEYKNLPGKGEFITLYPHLKNKDILLYLGRLSWKKGIDLIIKSLPEIKKINKKTHFVIAGNDEDNYKSELIVLIKSLKLSYVDFTSPSINQNEIVNSNITFTGYLDNLSKKKALVDSNIFILTSHSENFGMSVIEAMMTGLPVVISESVGISDIIKENNAGIVVKNTSEFIKNGIIELLNNKKLYDIIKENGQKLIRDRYDINKLSVRFKEALSEII